MSVPQRAGASWNPSTTGMRYFKVGFQAACTQPGDQQRPDQSKATPSGDWTHTRRIGKSRAAPASLSSFAANLHRGFNMRVMLVRVQVPFPVK